MQSNQTADDVANANQNQVPYQEYKVDQTKLQHLALQNEKFRQVPDEFKAVDFENFKYPHVRLKNGEYDDSDSNNPLAGHQSFSLGDVFYVDLNGDDKREAVVLISAVGCGASCDGGREIIYFYSSQNGKAKYLDSIETGANAGGCSLKSFTIENKKIIVEQFGRCVRDAAIDENKDYFCKFCVKDETRTVYSAGKSRLNKESSKITETGQINVMNSSALLSINN